MPVRSLFPNAAIHVLHFVLLMEKQEILINFHIIWDLIYNSDSCLVGFAGNSSFQFFFLFVDKMKNKCCREVRSKVLSNLL